MNQVITVQYLTDILKDEVTIFPTESAVAFLQFLLEPITQALDNLTSNDIPGFIESTFQDSLKSAINAYLQESNLYIQGAVLDYRIAVLYTILATLFKIGYPDATITDGILTAWDLYENIAPVFSETIFPPMIINKFRSIPQNADGYPLLPVVITIAAGDSYTHNISRDLCFGILALFKVTKTPNPAKLYGAPLTTEYNDISGMGVHPEWEDEIYYIVTILDDPKYTYNFMGKDFIQGIVTAAKWLNVDPHIYVIDLILADFKTPDITEDQMFTKLYY